MPMRATLCQYCRPLSEKLDAPDWPGRRIEDDEALPAFGNPVADGGAAPWFVRGSPLVGVCSGIPSAAATELRNSPVTRPWATSEASAVRPTLVVPDLPSRSRRNSSST